MKRTFKFKKRMGIFEKSKVMLWKSFLSGWENIRLAYSKSGGSVMEKDLNLHLKFISFRVDNKHTLWHVSFNSSLLAKRQCWDWNFRSPWVFLQTVCFPKMLFQTTHSPSSIKQVYRDYLDYSPDHFLISVGQFYWPIEKGTFLFLFILVPQDF